MATGTVGFGRKINVHRSPDNPFDRTTIVSIYPKPIEVINHTVFPGKFEIEAGNMEKPAILVIGSSSWFKDISKGDDPNPDFTEMKIASMEMANSIIDDYCRGLILADTERRPGLFFIPGDILKGTTIEKALPILKLNHKEMFEKALERQRAWFLELVNMADAFWQVSQSQRSIDNNMRMAAIELQLHEGKPWMADLSKLKMENCPACGFLRNNTFPVCAQCGTIVNPERYKEMGLQRSAK